MRRAIAVFALALFGTGCGNGVPDQGTVRTCFNTIGVAEPEGVKLGSVQGWIDVAEQAVTIAEHEQVRAAGHVLKAALSPDVQKDGFQEDERKRYADAVARMQKACKDSNAFKGNPRA